MQPCLVRCEEVARRAVQLGLSVKVVCRKFALHATSVLRWVAPWQPFFQTIERADFQLLRLLVGSHALGRHRVGMRFGVWTVAP